MYHDPIIHVPEDRTRVNVNVGPELEYWCSRFGCTEDKLRAAARAVGASARSVEIHLIRNR